MAAESLKTQALQLVRFCRSKPWRDNSGMTKTPDRRIMIGELGRVIKRLHNPVEVMLLCVRWYALHPLSLRHIEQMMAERGVAVDHATIHRWALKILPVLARMFRLCKRPISSSWRVDEPYILVAGQWKYLYREALVHGYPQPGSIAFPEVTRLLRPTRPTVSTPNLGITSRRCRSRCRTGPSGLSQLGRSASAQHPGVPNAACLRSSRTPVELAVCAPTTD